MFGKTLSLKKKKSAPTTPSKKWHCVEVKSSLEACEAVLEIEGKRFLSQEAPTLPLAGCDADCGCRYIHFEDRRQKDRRDRFVNSSINAKKVKRNRRMSGDRRRS